VFFSELSFYVSVGIFALRSMLRECSPLVTTLLIAIGPLNSVLLVTRVVSSFFGSAIANVIQPFFNIAVGLLGYLIIWRNVERGNESDLYNNYVIILASIAALCQVPWGYIAHHRPSWHHGSSGSRKSQKLVNLSKEPHILHCSMTSDTLTGHSNLMPQANAISHAKLKSFQKKNLGNTNLPNKSNRPKTNHKERKRIHLEKSSDSGPTIRERLTVDAHITTRNAATSYNV